MSQAMIDEFLQQPYIGVIATLRRDGRPYTVPVWWLWHEEAFWITGTYTRVWCRQLLHDPRASLCIETGAPRSGHIEADGRAEAFEFPDFDIWPISRMLAEKYVRPSAGGPFASVDAFFANMQTEPRLLFRLTPEVFRAIDMSVYRGKRADREFQQRASQQAPAG